MKLLGRLGGGQGPEALSPRSSTSPTKRWRRRWRRATSRRVLENVARELPRSKAMYLLNELLGNRIPHRIVSNCNTLIELACSHLEPEHVSACVTGAVEYLLGNPMRTAQIGYRGEYRRHQGLGAWRRKDAFGDGTIVDLLGGA